MAKSLITSSSTRPTAEIDLLCSAQHFHGDELNSELRSALKKVQQWLEGDDGWDEFLKQSHQEIVIHLEAMAQYRFLDSECEAEIGIERFAPPTSQGGALKVLLKPTDQNRLAYARQLIGRALETFDDSNLPTALAYPLNPSSPRVLGALVTIEGQSGPSVSWAGVYASRDAFMSTLRKRGFVSDNDKGSVSDEEILKFWQRD